MKIIVVVVLIAMAMTALWVVAPEPQKPSIPDDVTASTRRPVSTTERLAVVSKASSPAAGSVESNGVPDLVARVRMLIASGAPSEEIRAALESVAQRDPALALELALELARDDDEKSRLAGALLSSWAGRDLDAAWAWVAGADNRHVNGNPELTVTVLTVAASINAGRAVELVEAEMSHGRGRVEFANAAIDALIGTGHAELAREAVAQWAASEGVRPFIDNGAFEKVALHIAQQNRATASEWLRSLPASDGRNLALAALAADWSQSDPGQAMGWAAGLASEEGRLDSMQRVLNRWAEKDRIAAAEWLARNESHPTADKMIAALVGDTSLGEANPRIALQWVDLISDRNARAAALEQVVMAWSEKDPVAATRYVEETDSITAEQKQRLFEIFRSRTSPSMADH